MVRRPLFYCGISYAVAILVYYYLGGLAALILSACITFAAIKVTEPKRAAVVLIAAAYIISSINMYIYIERDDPMELFIGESVNLECRVKSVNNKTSSSGEEYTSMKVKVIRANGRELEKSSRILVTYYNQDCDLIPGQLINFTGEVEVPEGARNPGCFDYRLYLESIGIKETVAPNSVDIISNDVTLTGRLYKMKTGFIDRVRDYAGEDTAALLNGIMFGDKNQISKEEMRLFQMNATAHILAVSGLHIGIIYGFISRLWRGRKGYPYLIAIMCFFGLYSCIAGFAPSVVRASFMVSLHALSKVINRRYDLPSAAFLIFIIMLFMNPMSIFNSGLQMSFIAVMSMALLLPYTDRLSLGILTSSFTVQLGLLPYTMYSFNYLPLVGVLINIPIVFLAGLLLPIGLIAFLIYCLFGGCPEALVECLNILCKITSTVNRLACHEGITAISVGSPPRTVLGMYYLFLLVILSEEGRLMVMRRGRRYVIPAIIGIISVSLVFGMATRTGFEKTNLVFIDVGQGDSMHIKTEDGGNYLMDGGGKVDYDVGDKVLREYLLKNGVTKIDGAFISHLHTDHYKGIASLCKMNMVDKIYLYDGYKNMEDQIIEETGLERDQIVYIKKGDLLSLSNEIKVEILSPQSFQGVKADYEDENKFSLIMKVYFMSGSGSDYRSLLVTGDIDQSQEELLVKNCGKKLDVDILKVAHHGSKYSSCEAFIKASNPEIAAIQVGTNNYGHPSPDALERLEAVGSQIYRNDTMGAIGFNMSSSGNLIGVTMLQR